MGEPPNTSLGNWQKWRRFGSRRQSCQNQTTALTTSCAPNLDTSLQSYLLGGFRLLVAYGLSRVRHGIHQKQTEPRSRLVFCVRYGYGPDVRRLFRPHVVDRSVSPCASSVRIVSHRPIRVCVIVAVSYEAARGHRDGALDEVGAVRRPVVQLPYSSRLQPEPNT